MGLFFNTARIVGIRLLRIQNESWFAVKEYLGQDYQQVYEREYIPYVRNPEYRIEYAHPATSSLEHGGASMIIWK